MLKEQVEHHLEEEGDDLFPNVKKLLDEETLKLARPFRRTVIPARMKKSLVHSIRHR